MEKKRVYPDVSQFPPEIMSILDGAAFYDSSCSPEAVVVFAEKNGGYFLKTSGKGSLYRESVMTKFFHEKKLAAAVLAYVSDERDWLLTERVPGDDCTALKHLEQPERLCDTIAETLLDLHGMDYTGCPVRNHTEIYTQTAVKNYRAGKYDESLFPDNWGYASAEEAFRTVEGQGSLLASDTLLHGDYCLPNVMLDGWKLSGYVDLCNGGVGDRHVDIFWAGWSLSWNLKSAKYRERLYDAYGRASIDETRLRIVAAHEVFG